MTRLSKAGIGFSGLVESICGLLSEWHPPSLNTETAYSNPRGKLADAELHFTDGVLEGTKLIGFAVWERRTGGGRNVTFPARQYSVNGERRTFALLRPIASDASGQERIRELVLQAYAEYEETGREVA